MSSDSNRKEGQGGPRKRKRRRGGSKKNTPSQIDEEAVLRAKERFNRSPPAMGLPINLDPPPKQIKMNWKLSPVPKNVEREVHDIVCRPGEFGFLDDERVDEIAEQLGDRPISLEQALSLRAALNQEKAVFSHGRLQRRAREMSRKYEAEKVSYHYQNAMISLQSIYSVRFYLREIGRKIVSRKLFVNPIRN